MVSAWDFPTSIEVNGHEYPIRTDYRAVIDLLIALSSPDTLGDTEEETNYIRTMIVLEIMFPNFETIEQDDLSEAIKKVFEFIDMGMDDDSHKNNIRLMDWEQDAGMIIPAVNRVLNKEIRAESYIHWWTFLSAYLEIGECSFSHVVALRDKKAKGKKLEKWEQDFIRENKNVILLHSKKTDEDRAREEAEKKALAELLG